MEETTYHYRKLITSDMQRILALNMLTMQSLSRPDFFAPTLGNELDYLFDERFFHYIGATTETQGYKQEILVGSVRLDINQDYLKSFKEVFQRESILKESEPICEVSHCMIHPNHRHRGIMSKLIQQAEDKANKLGFRNAFATVCPDNVPSIRTFEKAGYQNTKIIIKNFLGQPRCIFIKKLY